MFLLLAYFLLTRDLLTIEKKNSTHIHVQFLFFPHIFQITDFVYFFFFLLYCWQIELWCYFLSFTEYHFFLFVCCYFLSMCVKIVFFKWNSIEHSMICFCFWFGSTIEWTSQLTIEKNNENHFCCQFCMENAIIPAQFMH